MYSLVIHPAALTLPCEMPRVPQGFVLELCLGVDALVKKTNKQTNKHPRIPPGWKHRPRRPGCQRCSVPIACDISCLLAPALATHGLGCFHQHAGRLAAFHGKLWSPNVHYRSLHVCGVFWVYPRVPWHMDFRLQTLHHRTLGLQQTRLGRVCVASPPPPLRPCPRWKEGSLHGKASWLMQGPQRERHAHVGPLDSAFPHRD